VRNKRRMLGSGRGYGKPMAERPCGARSLLYSSLCNDMRKCAIGRCNKTSTAELLICRLPFVVRAFYGNCDIMGLFPGGYHQSTYVHHPACN